MISGDPRPRKWRWRITISGLMIAVALVALALYWFRPMTRGEAIRLAIAAAQSDAVGSRVKGDRPPSYRVLTSGFDEHASRLGEGWVVELLENGGPYGYRCEIVGHRVERTAYGQFSGPKLVDPNSGSYSWGMITPRLPVRTLD